MLPAAPILRHGSEGALHIDMEISLPVSILGDLESGYREISTAIKEEEKDVKDKQQYTSVVMKREVERLLQVSNVVASDYGGGENKPNTTS